MNRAREVANHYGVRVEIADLGDWGSAQLRSEYDPNGFVIRINRRVIAGLNEQDVDRFITDALAHELYHHREYIGEVALLRDARARERAADEFARSLALAAE
jgi:hypothetical protein